jgi:orotate phosphoribosyltransferase
MNNGLYPMKYHIPTPLRSKVRGKRVAILNDVINAGSAVRATFDDLQSCGAEPVAIGALLILGDSIRSFAAANNLSIETISQAPYALWEPAACPLCASNTPLDN